MCSGASVPSSGSEPDPSPIAVGVDVGGTKILAVAVDAATRRPVGEPVRSATPKLDATALVDAVAAAVDAVEASVGRPAAAIGVGLPGLVDTTGTLAMGPHLPGIRHQRFRPAFERRLGRPVHVDNDATCAVWAEHVLGAGRGASDVVMVTLGTGIGSGIVAGGRVVRGAHGFAGEPGHTVIDPDGPPCPCGRRGCWERYASGTALVRLAGGRSSEDVIAAATAGEPEATEALGRFAWWFALGVANLVAVLDPEVVVVGGGLVEAGEVLFGPLRRAHLDLVMAGDARPAVRIVPAELGERANAIGAALLAGDQLGCGT
jgi:glucokinase